MTDQDMIGWIEAAPLDALMAQAAKKRDAAHGRLVSYSTLAPLATRKKSPVSEE